MDVFVDGVAPPGMERLVKRLKRYRGIDNPWALAWWIHNNKGKSELTDDEVDACIDEYLKSCGLNPEATIDSSMKIMTPADAIQSYVELLVSGDIKANHSALDYVEAPGGTRCATCRYAVHVMNDQHDEDEAECAIMYGKISLHNGCCAAWSADPDQLSVMMD